MKSFSTLVFLLFFMGSVLPVMAVVNGLDVHKNQPSPPLKLLNTPQKSTSQPSLSPLAGTQPPISRGATEELRDIQGPINLPTPKNYWFFIGIAILILLLVALLVFWLKKRTKTIQPRPAYEVALAEIAKAKSWMTEKRGIVYAQRLSEILRQYIESRFFVHSTRKTTHELLSELQADSATTNVIYPHLDGLQNCLEQCDMAKFAHLSPDTQDMAQMESAVIRFVETTKTDQPEGATA